MGTSLTGLTPATTYDALIKVTDNGPLSGTAKYLSDGLGNDSVLALSTSNVGIGTSSPSQKLEVVGSFVRLGASVTDNSNAGAYFQVKNGATIVGQSSQFVSNSGDWVLYTGTTSETEKMRISSTGDVTLQTVNAQLRFQNTLGPAPFIANAGTNNQDLYVSSGGSERMRITSSGNVGIGTSAPNSKLEVFAGTAIYPINITSSSGSATTTGISMGSFTGLAAGSNGSVYIASAHNHSATAQSDMVFYTHTGSALTEKGRFLAGGGLTFNGDTAAANALDDYEEGTWTPTFNAAVTTSGTPTGKYTKVGRTVYATCTFTYTDLTGGDISIDGLPFTNGGIRQATAVAFSGVVRTTNQFFGTLVEANGTNFYIEVVNSATGVNLTAHASCWYQV